MTNSIALWYVARATGLVALVLLTATIVWGMLGASHTAPASWPRFVGNLLHRNLSVLTVSFLAVHVGSSVVDGYAGIGWLDAIVPFGSVYHPFWLGLGAIAFDLLLALVITSLLRSRMPARLWRAVHWVGYLCWPVAIIHGLGIGTDSRSGWPLALSLLCLAAVVTALLWRLARVGTGSLTLSGGRRG